MNYKQTLFLATLFYATGSNALVSLTLSNNEVSLGNAVQLIFQSDKEINPYPITSEISKKAKIRGQSSASNIQITNGSRTDLYTLTITIFPLTEGEITFGPFEINQEKTNTVTLNVLPQQNISSQAQKSNNNEQSSQENNAKNNVIFEASVMPKTIYEGQTGIYQLSLFDPIQIYNIALTPPKSFNLNLTKLNQDKVSTDKIGNQIGKIYQSFFSFSPTTSGSITLSPAELSADIPDNSTPKPVGYDSFFDTSFNDRFFISPFQKQIPIYFQSNPVTIQVKPKPNNWQGWWLPAIKAELTEEFSAPEPLRIGDAIERKITLTVTGTEPDKLPLIEHPQSQKYTLFNNPENRYSFFENNQITSVEVKQILIIPQAEGELTLPPITVKYFDTVAEEEKITSTQGKTFQVLPPLQTPVSGTNLKETPPIQPIENTPIQKKEQKEQHPLIGAVFLYLGALIILISSTIIGLLLRRKRKKQFTSIESSEETPKIKKKKKPLPDLYPF